MKDLNPKELAFSVASIFAMLALILLIPSILVTSTDIFTAFCLLFWVFCFICLGIGCSVPKDLNKIQKIYNKPKKVYPIEIV
tara:strand:- start:190 stop:435 length:246 start_codon:yes stop_codon:yes gene_type:complete